MGLTEESTWEDIIAALEIKFPKVFYPLTLSDWGLNGNNNKSFSISSGTLTFTSKTTLDAVTYSNTCSSPKIDFDKYSNIKMKGSAYTGGGEYNYAEIYLSDGNSTKKSLVYLSAGESKSDSKTFDIDLDISSLTGIGRLVIHLWGKFANSANAKITLLELR